MNKASGSAAYSLFSPPGELAAKSPTDWTDAEASRYLLWLVNSIDGRVANLLQFVGEPEITDCRALLRKVGDKVVWVVQKPGFATTEQDNARLTEAGLSFAADLGLLVGRCLVRVNPEIHWEVLRRPKTDASYNQPVLRGFGTRYLEPVRGSAAELGRLIRGEGSADAWLQIFDYWRDESLKQH